jgi:hypothetical protein
MNVTAGMFLQIRHDDDDDDNDDELPMLNVLC